MHDVPEVPFQHVSNFLDRGCAFRSACNSFQELPLRPSPSSFRRQWTCLLDLATDGATCNQKWTHY